MKKMNDDLLAMQKIPISFDYKGKHYEGTFDEVSGAGANGVFHLTIQKHHYGQLMLTDRGWVFHSNSGEMEDLANIFGNYVELWVE